MTRFSLFIILLFGTFGFADGRSSSLVFVRRSKRQACDEGDSCGIVTDCYVIHRMGSIIRWRQPSLQRRSWWKMKTLFFLHNSTLMLLFLAFIKSHAATTIFSLCSAVYIYMYTFLIEYYRVKSWYWLLNVSKNFKHVTNVFSQRLV